MWIRPSWTASPELANSISLRAAFPGRRRVGWREFHNLARLRDGPIEGGLFCWKGRYRAVVSADRISHSVAAVPERRLVQDISGCITGHDAIPVGAGRRGREVATVQGHGMLWRGACRLVRSNPAERATAARKRVPRTWRRSARLTRGSMSAFAMSRFAGVLQMMASRTTRAQERGKRRLVGGFMVGKVLENRNL